MKTIRTFIAFALPGAVTRLAGALQDDLKAHQLRMRWVRPKNIHLTLKFLGEIQPERSVDVLQAMRRAALAVPPFELSVQGIGVFPGMRKPRVLWIGLGGHTAVLQTLVACLEDELAVLGFQRENRPFKAHLTLARADGQVDARQLLQAIQAVGQFAPQTLPASEMILFHSDLKPQGAVYNALERVPLRGGQEKAVSGQESPDS